MGAVFSSLMLMFGSVVSAVLSALAASKVSGKDWSKVKLYAGIALGVALLMLALAFFFFVRSKLSTSAISEVLPGFDMSMILMILVTIGMAVMDGFAIANASSSTGQKTKKAESFSAGASALGFGGVVISLVLIVILM
jgi:membrane-associated HD superfamily phosphohydrolase